MDWNKTEFGEYEKRRKLDVKSRECIFVGYSAESKAYRVYDLEKRTLSISRDVIFVEKKSRQQVIETPAINTNNVYIPTVNHFVTEASETPVHEENPVNETGSGFGNSLVTEAGATNTETHEHGVSHVNNPVSTPNAANLETEFEADSTITNIIENSLLEPNGDSQLEDSVNESFEDANENISTANVAVDDDTSVLEIPSDDDEQTFNASIAAEQFIRRRVRSQTSVPTEPATPDEALQRSDGKKWEAAM